MYTPKIYYDDFNFNNYSGKIYQTSLCQRIDNFLVKLYHIIYQAC